MRQSMADMPDLKGIEVERVPNARATGWTARLLYDRVYLPRRLQQERFGVVVSLTNTGPIWSPTRHVSFKGTLSCIPTITFPESAARPEARHLCAGGLLYSQCDGQTL